MELVNDSNGQLKVSLGLAEKWIGTFIGAAVLTYFVWSAATLQTMTVKVAVMATQMESFNAVPQNTQRIGNLELRMSMQESGLTEVEDRAAALEAKVNTLERVTPRE